MSELHDQLRNFIGTTQYFKHPLYTTPVYTDGVQYLLQKGAKGQGCYWLLDLLATEPAIRKQAEEFASITVVVENRQAHIVVDDGNGSKPVFNKVIGYTDLEPGTIKLYWIKNVLLLANEY